MQDQERLRSRLQGRVAAQHGEVRVAGIDPRSGGGPVRDRKEMQPDRLVLAREHMRRSLHQTRVVPDLRNGDRELDGAVIDAHDRHRAADREQGRGDQGWQQLAHVVPVSITPRKIARAFGDFKAEGK